MRTNPFILAILFTIAFGICIMIVPTFPQQIYQAYFIVGSMLGFALAFMISEILLTDT